MKNRDSGIEPITANTGPTLSRRGLWQGAAAVTAVATFGGATRAQIVETGSTQQHPGFDQLFPPSGPKTAADYPVSATTERLASYISTAGEQGLPSEVVEQTKWHILDTLAAVVAGSQLPAGQVGQAFLKTVGGNPVATVLGSQIRTDAINAAMINGTAGHAHEIDDTGGASGPWHPGINAVSAALALGEQFDVDGSRFLRAVTCGYDIGGRVGTAAGLLRNFRTPTVSVCGVFGALAAAASIAKLNPEQVRFALSYAAQQSSGIDSFRRDPDHIEKGFINGGIGGRAGVTAVLLVRAGFTGVHDIFHGPANFFALFQAAGQDVEPELMVKELGSRFDVLATGFKRRPVAGAISAVLDSLEVLLARQPINPAEIAQIIVRYEPNSVTDNSGPPDVNMQHAVAMTLVDKQLSFRSIHDRSRFTDPQIVRLRSIIRISPVTIYNQTGKYIDPSTPGRAAQLGSKAPVIQIIMANGQVYAQEDVAARGEGSNPFTREWIVDKATSLMTPVLGKRRTTQAVERVLHLEQLGSVRELASLLTVQHADSRPRLSDWPLDTRS